MLQRGEHRALRVRRVRQHAGHCRECSRLLREVREHVLQLRALLLHGGDRLCQAVAQLRQRHRRRRHVESMRPPAPALNGQVKEKDLGAQSGMGRWLAARR